jgi:hypothetical protein
MECSNAHLVELEHHNHEFHNKIPTIHNSQLPTFMADAQPAFATKMQQMLADMACFNAQMNACLTKLENDNRELQSAIHNLQSPTFTTSAQSQQLVHDLQLTSHTPEL